MSLTFAILTVSDRSAAGTREDLSGPALGKAVERAGWVVSAAVIIPDEIQQITDQLKTWADSGGIQVILTTGGTGFAPRDITPEATAAVIDRHAPGLAEAMRAGSLNITPHAMLSRATAGIRKNTLIINLPGSPKGALENFRIIAPVLPHAVQLLENDDRAEAGHHPGWAV
ncbi:MAG: MogA/MoaB family molybdenum cofactor biosynthesis protein [Anaerolineales bacterium]|nr:MogA/MoaB family molybdenum cofactor biosynthesis protein [Anaerolineales bacterium]